MRFVMLSDSKANQALARVPRLSKTLAGEGGGPPGPFSGVLETRKLKAWFGFCYTRKAESVNRGQRPY
jgi:hypothetical protein